MNRTWPQILSLLALVSGLCLLCRSTHAAPDCTVDASVEPSETDNFYEARSRFWVANGCTEPRGVLVLLSGTDCDARGMVSDPFWQTLAKREQLALLGVYFRGEGEPYESAAGGSGAALLRMIEQVAAAAGFPQLAHPPLLLVGHSAGAMFAFNFAGWAPQHTAAFVAVKTGPVTANPDPRFAAVPGLFIVGEHDMDARIQSAAAAFASVARPSAWALAFEPSSGHEWTAADNRLIDVYLRGLLSRPRPPDDRSEPAYGPAPARGEFRNLSAPFAAKSILPASADAVCLPDAASASAWKRFTKPVRVAELLTWKTEVGGTGLTVEPATLRLEASPPASLSPDELAGSVFVRVSHAGFPGCTFDTGDSRLTITVVPLETGCYRLDVRLRTAGLPGGFYRSNVNVVAQDQQKVPREFSVPLLAWIRSVVELTPSSLYVGVLGRGEACERKVTLPLTSTGTIWKIRSVQSSKPQFATAMLDAVRIGSGTFVCRFDAKAALGNQSGCFELVLEDGASGIHLKLPFIAFVSKRPLQNQGDATRNKSQ